MDDMLSLLVCNQPVLVAVKDGDAGPGGKSMVPLIQRDSTIPCKRTSTFETSRDGQTSACIEICEGWGTPSFLGSCLVVGMPAAPKGQVAIEVTADFDANNLLTILVAFRHNDGPKSPSIDFTPGVEAWGIRKDFNFVAPGAAQRLVDNGDERVELRKE